MLIGSQIQKECVHQYCQTCEIILCHVVRPGWRLVEMRLVKVAAIFARDRCTTKESVVEIFHIGRVTENDQISKNYFATHGPVKDQRWLV